MKSDKILGIFIGILLIITSISRFIQIYFDPIGNIFLYTIFDTISADNIFSLLGNIIIGITFLLIAGTILGFLYSAIYLAEGLAILFLKNTTNYVKSIIILTVFSGILEISALMILTVNTFPYNLILFHFIIDMIVFSSAISILIINEIQHNKILKSRENYVLESLPKEVQKGDVIIKQDNFDAAECLNTLTLDCLNVDY